MTYDSFKKIMHTLFLGSQYIINNGHRCMMIDLQKVADVLASYTDQEPSCQIQFTDDKVVLSYAFSNEAPDEPGK